MRIFMTLLIVFTLTCCSGLILDHNKQNIEKPNVPASEQTTEEKRIEFYPDLLMNWYAENYSDIMIKNDVITKSVNSKVSRCYDRYLINNIPFESPIDCASFAILNQEGFNSITNVTALNSPIVPKSFLYSDVKMLRYCKNVFLSSSMDICNIRKDFELEENEYNYFLNRYLDYSQDYFSVISYLVFEDYQYSIADYSLSAVINTNDKNFLNTYGNSWKSSSKSGISLGSRKRINIIDYGSYSKEQIMIAYKILESNEEDATYSSLARLWAYSIFHSFEETIKSEYFVANFYIKNQMLIDEYTKLQSQKKAVIQTKDSYTEILPNSYGTIGENKPVYYIDDVINGINNGYEIDYNVNSISFMYSYY